MEVLATVLDEMPYGEYPLGLHGRIIFTISKTYDKSFSQMIIDKLLQPIEFRFEPFGIYDSFVTHPNRTDILIFGSYRPNQNTSV